MLGLSQSTFDTAEYFDYLIPTEARRFDREQVIARLKAIPEPGANSGNEIAVRKDCAYLIHWRSPSDTLPRYFTMQQLRTPDCHVISSEIIPSLAPAYRWQAVTPQSVMEFKI